MRIRRTCCAHRNRRRVEAAGSKFKDRLNLLPRDIVLLHDLLDARTHLEVFKDRGDRHTGIAKNPRTAPPTRYAFDGGALRPIKSSHKTTLLLPDRKSTRLNSSHLGISYAV